MAAGRSGPVFGNGRRNPQLIVFSVSSLTAGSCKAKKNQDGAVQPHDILIAESAGSGSNP